MRLDLKLQLLDVRLQLLVDQLPQPLDFVAREKVPILRRQLFDGLLDGRFLRQPLRP